MSLSAKIVNLALSGRLADTDRFRKDPLGVQAGQFGYLVRHLAETRYGHVCGVRAGMSPEEFRRQVPVVTYDDFHPYIDACRQGEDSVLWPGRVHWFAKSSGTTADRSKYIPVTPESLRDCHFRGGKDVAAFFTHNHPGTGVFSGKTLTLGGSHAVDRLNPDVHAGDLSAILIQNTPFYARMNRTPKKETALIADFETKVRRICEETAGQNVTSFAGVPSWNLVLMNRILEYTGRSHMLEVWPRMELFVHGGVSFGPYREPYRRLFPSDGMKYMETYNASEGFFAIQDDPASEDMLLMLDYGIYYEFLPMRSLDDPSQAVPLEGVRTGENYALVISTNGGLWRYLIGDTVTFTSTSPYKIRITGRTKHFINAFGEEVIIDNAEQAVRLACERTGAVVSDYTAAPVYMDGRTKGAHQWLIEFGREPSDVGVFTDVLDRTLQSVNSDYEAKRFRDTTLLRPVVTVLPPGTFYEWMKRRGRLGGQNKIPRLSNDRRYADALLELDAERRKAL